MKDLRFVFFTNEKNINFFSLTLKYFLSHVKENEKISVILNKITQTDLPYKDKVEYIDADVDFDSQGKHLGESLSKITTQFKEKYLFLFLDDYFLISNVNYEHLDSVMEIIDKENIDCFSFEYMGAEEFLHSIPFDTDNKYLKNNLYIKTNKHRYLYSLQPSIWKNESLQKLYGENRVTLHEMDETMDNIKEKNELKCLSNTLDSFFNQIDIQNREHFGIAYCELLRHGVFPTAENGFNVSEDEPMIKLIRKIIKEENLLGKEEFSKKLGNIK